VRYAILAHHGTPISNVDHTRNIIVLTRSMAAGYSGVENELFYHPKTEMLFGDAKKSLEKLVAEVKAAGLKCAGAFVVKGQLQ
jgi:NAD/NADP transhydrogenase beta subunit